MFIHKPLLISPVNVKDPDPKFAEMMLEQFGGATGELSAALQYYTQSFHMEDPGIRDMLQDIATEEFSHLEVIGMLIEQHTKHATADVQDKAFQSTLFAIRGPGPHLLDSKGSAWTATYVNEGGHPARDLRANVSAEAGALQTYEALLTYAQDEGTRKALNFLGTREISHAHMFMEALRSIGKLTEPAFGDLKPDSTVNLYFNLSNGQGSDLRGPWNAEPTFQYVSDPLKHVQQYDSGKSGANMMELVGNPSDTNSSLGDAPPPGKSTN